VLLLKTNDFKVGGTMKKTKNSYATHVFIVIIFGILAVVATITSFPVKGDLAGSGECIKDSDSGLMWEIPRSKTTLSWMSAINLPKPDVCGVKGWRIPTRGEFKSLVDCKKQSDGGQESSGVRCTALFPVKGHKYWTVESYGAIPVWAWAVDLETGRSETLPKVEAVGVILVTSDGMLKSRYGCNTPLPTWDQTNSVMDVPEFASNPYIKSIRLQVDLDANTFNILEHK